MAGGLYNEVGLLISLNEIGRSVVLYSGIFIGSISLPKNILKHFSSLAVDAAHHLGGANLEGMDEYWEKHKVE